VAFRSETLHSTGGVIEGRVRGREKWASKGLRGDREIGAKSCDLKQDALGGGGTVKGGNRIKSWGSRLGIVRACSFAGKWKGARRYVVHRKSNLGNAAGGSRRQVGPVEKMEWRKEQRGTVQGQTSATGA